MVPERQHVLVRIVPMWLSLCLLFEAIAMCFWYELLWFELLSCLYCYIKVCAAIIMFELMCTCWCWYNKACHAPIVCVLIFLFPWSIRMVILQMAIHQTILQVRMKLRN
jgi:hypothetical protein